MHCRAATIAPSPPPSARERPETIEQRARAAQDALKQGASGVVVSGLLFEIESIAQVGSAYERRRERGEVVS